MNVLTNWNTFLKLWVYFTAFDIVIFMLIANIYINGYLEYKERRGKKHGNRRTKKSCRKIRQEPH